jgi:predicted Na+-dependent transporter
MRRSQRNQTVALAMLFLLMYAVVATPVVFLASSGVTTTGILGGLAAFVGSAGTLTWRAFRRAYRNSVDRIQLRLEQLLDDLEHGRLTEPPNLLQKVVGQITAR